MKYFHDIHFHVMTLLHPDFIDYSKSLDNGVGEILFSGLLSPNYIFTPKVHSKDGVISKTLNALNAFVQPIGKTLVMMEEDLEGVFIRPDYAYKESDYPSLPYIRDGKFHFRSETFDKLAMSPLIMDFSRNPKDINRTYYIAKRSNSLLEYVNDTLEGIEYYKKNKPNGLFDFFPFFGINTCYHEFKEIKELLETFFIKGKTPFVGIKLYPPLGFDPWPEGNKEEMDKVNYLYSFCIERNLPIITHCDNQGFRSINVKDATKYTSPSRWEKVLKNYPKLKLDFAHFGYKYNLKEDAYNKLLETFDLPMDNSWFRKIIELMLKYPNVYSDLSYTGTMPKFYVQLNRFLEEKEENTKKIIKSRILFGSDFSVNLFKIPSYMNYYHIFETSPFSDEDILTFANKNPSNFLNFN